MPNTRTTNIRLITDIDGTPMSRYEWNRLADTVDRQVHAALDKLGGSGIISGGTILSSKEVSATCALVDGAIGVTSAPQAITGLLDNQTNSVWCVRVEPASDLPGNPSTYNTGALNFVAADVQPAHSTLVGTIALDSEGAVGVIDNTVYERKAIIPAAATQYEVVAEVEGLTTGLEEWVEVSHPSVVFRAALLLEVVSVTTGFTATRLENCQPNKFGFLCKNVSGSGTCSVSFKRTGILA